MINEEPQQHTTIIDSPELFGMWLEANRGRINVILQQKTSNELRAKVGAEDILQEAASRAVVAVAKMRLADQEVMPWFLQILNHAIIDLHRHHFGAQKRDASREVSVAKSGGSDGEQVHLAELLVASITSPSKAFSQHVRLNRMEEALAQLAPEARQAIQWRYMDGMTSQDIATRLNKSDGAVRVLLTRTLKKLEELLADVRP